LVGIVVRGFVRQEDYFFTYIENIVFIGQLELVLLLGVILRLVCGQNVTADASSDVMYPVSTNPATANDRGNISGLFQYFRVNAKL
jgi:hypothetical protein